ncbi:MAG TPA: pyruvate kinase [Desulfobacterales bacterium]|nr:pyruvate kinase [Desulfobacterales bacterium]
MKFNQLFRYWLLQIFLPGRFLRYKYRLFQELLHRDQRCLELLTALEEILHKQKSVDWARIEKLVRELITATRNLIRSLAAMHPTAYDQLEEQLGFLNAVLDGIVTLPENDSTPPYTVSLGMPGLEPALVGGKAHALNRIALEAGLPMPEGFIITTKAFQLFLQHNRLRPRLNELLAEVDPQNWEQLTQLSEKIMSLVENGEVPAVVGEEIACRVGEYHRRGLDGPWCLRSSALSEDGEASFAGQYLSVLQVADQDILAAYKGVLASKYSPRALAYRLHCGLADQDTPMAVIFLEMIDAVTGGVMYTQTPELVHEADAPLAVYAVCGLGRQLVDGRAEPEIFYLTREAAPRPLEFGSEPRSCLSSATAVLLAQWGMMLETMFGRPQDIEWCQDKVGNCYILQSRPLKIESSHPGATVTGKELIPPDSPILLEGGVTASSGVAAGEVYVIRNETDLGQVPEGAVLAAPILSPSFVSIIGRLRAVVAHSGSQASHFASVAREFGLPVIAGASEATKRLASGMSVIVDADRCRVYQGSIATLTPRPATPFTSRQSPFFSRLHRIMKFISPLRLIDPTSPDFAPQNCQSIHDLVRFAHEKGMAEMFFLTGRSGRGLGRARRLDAALPFTLYVLDLDESISPAAKGRKSVALEFIASRPLLACLQGLTHPEVVWRQGLVYLDWEEIDRVSAGIVNLKSAALASYALVGRHYLHLVLRFGYHFAVLDCLCGGNPEANYIAFRFKGGGGNYENRLLRVQLIQEVLTWAGFKVITEGDLLEARFERRHAETVLSRLTLLGILQGKTQLLDISLNDDDQVVALVRSLKEKFADYVGDG